jgi:hypothetical protein
MVHKAEVKIRDARFSKYITSNNGLIEKRVTVSAATNVWTL